MNFRVSAQADLHVRGVSMSKLRTRRAEHQVKQLTTKHAWSAFALAAAIVVAAPAIVVSQGDRGNEPWNDPWSGPWPTLLAGPIAIDPEVAALQQRIDASLERLMKASVEA